MVDRYNTGDPRPSNSMKNLSDNALAFDDFVNSDGDNAVDRFGKEFPTISKLIKNVDEAFSSQLSIQESTFSESQTDKESRFQQFLNTSGYVFLGDYQDGPFQFSARNQYIRYNNQYYRLNAATDVGFTTTGTDATSFANDVTHFVLMDGDTLRQNMSAGDGLKYIGQCADYAALRQVTPEYPGQQILVRSACESWSPSGSALPGEPASFVCLSGMKLADFPDDGGTLIAAADGVSVWVNMALFRDRKIHVSWFGAKNNYTDDASAAI